LTKHISIHICFGLLIGIILSSYLNISVTISWILLSVLFIVLLAVYFISKHLFNPKFYFALASFLMFLAIGTSRLTFAKENLYKNHYTHFLKQKNTLVLVINQVLKPSRNYQKYEAEVQQINQQSAVGKLLLYIKKDSLKKSLSVGQFIFTDAKITDVEGVKNPFQFDYKTYLEKKQIYKQIYTSAGDISILPIKNHSIKVIANNIRKKIIANLKAKGLKGDELVVVKALLLGERTGLSSDLQQNYAAAGAMHILAISGLHIGIIMLLIGFVLKPLELLKNGSVLKLILLVFSLWFYATLAGLSPSVVRATTMFTALSFGLFLNRKTDLINVLALSAIILLLFNPFYIFDVGFKMSYLAVLAIILFLPKISGLWHPKLKPINYFWQLISVSAAAQIGVLPLSLYYFHQFPGLFFLTNIVIIPLLGIILGLGLILIILAYFNGLPAFFVDFYQNIIHLLNQFVAWVAHQESFLFKNIPFSLALLLASYLVIIVIYNWSNKPSFKSTLAVCLSLLGMQSVLFYEKYKTSKSNELIVFNNYKKPLIAIKKGNNLQLMGSPDNLNNYTLTAYEIGAKIHKIKIHKKPLNIFMVDGKTVLVVDKASVYKFLPKINIVVLTQSPKVNLDRLIQQLKPQQIIADDSNYTSFIARWQITCNKTNTPFYNTSKRGAFIYNF